MGPGGAVTDATAAVDPARYRQAMGRFATGVAVVTSRHRGHDVALTVDSLTSVSLAPVLLLVSLHPEARVLEGVESGVRKSCSWMLGVKDVLWKPRVWMVGWGLSVRMSFNWIFCLWGGRRLDWPEA